MVFLRKSIRAPSYNRNYYLLKVFCYSFPGRYSHNWSEMSCWNQRQLQNKHYWFTRVITFNFYSSLLNLRVYDILIWVTQQNVNLKNVSLKMKQINCVLNESQNSLTFSDIKITSFWSSTVSEREIFSWRAATEN